ncbi:MAG TPA: hypothetical protein VF553_04275 [Pyrinomonadaceae bacterium]|jgi:hypothetical protein
MIELESDISVSRPDHSRGVCLSIADLHVALYSDDPSMKLEVEGATNLFVVEDAKPDATVRAGWAELDDQEAGEPLFDSGALWRLYREGSGYLWRFQTPYFGRIPYKTARFNHDFTRGEVLLHRPYFETERAVYPLEYPLDELLLLNLLAGGKGVELHSSGIRDEAGEGSLFVGQSGAGKTTIARLWERREGVEILSDDRVVVRKVDGQFYMYGTPWHGEARYSSPLRTPLRRLFFLRQGVRNELEELKRAEAAARLFACSFPTYHDTDALCYTLELFDQLTKEIACRELSFTPDEGAVDFIRRQAI